MVRVSQIMLKIGTLIIGGDDQDKNVPECIAMPIASK